MCKSKLELPLNLRVLKVSYNQMGLEKTINSTFYASKSVQTFSLYKPISKLFVMKF